MQKIIAESPIVPPGSNFIYSDINYETLGELVHRISGQVLDVYCAQHIFRPLGMRDHVQSTRQAPIAHCADRVRARYHGQDVVGEVRDPRSRYGRSGGACRPFSTASDLAIFAQMILNGEATGVSAS
jgi:CubicO group peptidase (beta-lactamase class C family)